jgi:hypothetical protein
MSCRDYTPRGYKLQLLVMASCQSSTPTYAQVPHEVPAEFRAAKWNRIVVTDGVWVADLPFLVEKE